MSSPVLGYDHETLRLKAMQARNVERILGAAARQRDAIAEDGLPPLAWTALDAAIGALSPIREGLKKELATIMRGSSIDAWVQRTKGLGPGLYFTLGQMPPINEFANPAKVWRYCGLDVRDGKAPRRQRGEVAGFNPFLRAAVLYRVADPIVKVGGPYRAVYDARKERTRETRPEWTDGHRHADALRITAKAVLLDAWRVARGLPPRVRATAPTSSGTDLPVPAGVGA